MYKVSNQLLHVQISAVESGSKGVPGTGTDESTLEYERGEVQTPTVSAIDAAENPLDRRAMVSLKKQLEIDKPQTRMDFSVSFIIQILFFFLMFSSTATYQGVPHVLLVRGKPQGTGVSGSVR